MHGRTESLIIILWICHDIFIANLNQYQCYRMPGRTKLYPLKLGLLKPRRYKYPSTVIKRFTSITHNLFSFQLHSVRIRCTPACPRWWSPLKWSPPGGSWAATSSSPLLQAPSYASPSSLSTSSPLTVCATHSRCTTPCCLWGGGFFIGESKWDSKQELKKKEFTGELKLDGSEEWESSKSYGNQIRVTWEVNGPELLLENDDDN